MVMSKDEILKAMQGDTQKGLNSALAAESNSTPEPKTYTEKEVKAREKKASEDAVAQYGDKIKREKLDPVTKERDELKSRVAELEIDIESATGDREDSGARVRSLEKDLETAIAASGDSASELNEIQSIRRELREEREKFREHVKTEKKAIAELKKTAEQEREEHAQEVAEARKMKFEVDVFEVSEDYVDGDKPLSSERLRSFCEKANVTKREDIIEIADMFWTKKTSGSDEELEIVTDSGEGSGAPGGFTKKQIDNMSPNDIFKNYKELAKLPSFRK